MNEQDRDLEALLGQASPRPEPPEHVRNRVLQAVEAEWHRHKRRRWRLPLAMAASLLVAGAAGLLVTEAGAGTEITVSATHGLWVDGVAHDQVGEVLTLPRRAVLEARGTTRLVTEDIMEVRMRKGTRLTWMGPDEVALERGAIYVDTGGRANLRVRTPMGVVRDIGTTFMVTLEGDAMEVAMRDGEVEIDTDFGQYQAQARDYDGDVVVVGTQRIVADVEPASADRWQWIHDVAPGYGRQELPYVLGEIADDLGLRLEYASPAVAAAAQTLIVEGELHGLGPEEALKVALGTTGLVRLTDQPGRLIVAIQSGDDHQ